MEKQELEKEIKTTLIIGVITLIFFLFLFVFCVQAEPIPQSEKQIIEQVADEYGLEGEARTFLTVIRVIENGAVGREFGILTKKAMRYPNNPQKSFITQARWAAGTIKKRFTGDLKAFADKYCPVGAKNDPEGLNNHWYKNAKHWMDKLK